MTLRRLVRECTECGGAGSSTPASCASCGASDFRWVCVAERSSDRRPWSGGKCRSCGTSAPSECGEKSPAAKPPPAPAVAVPPRPAAVPLAPLPSRHVAPARPAALRRALPPAPVPDRHDDAPSSFRGGKLLLVVAAMVAGALAVRSADLSVTDNVLMRNDLPHQALVLQDGKQIAIVPPHETLTVTIRSSLGSSTLIRRSTKGAAGSVALGDSVRLSTWDLLSGTVKLARIALPPGGGKVMGIRVLNPTGPALVSVRVRRGSFPAADCPNTGRSAECGFWPTGSRLAVTIRDGASRRFDVEPNPARRDSTGFVTISVRQLRERAIRRKKAKSK